MSFCVIAILGPPAPSCSTYAKVRPSATTRGDRAAAAPSSTPSAVRIPARYSSATASMIPDPQIPVTVVPAYPGSSDQAGVPITRTRGSRVARSIRTRSIAPGAARCPAEICAPSNAGPVGASASSTPAVSAPTWPAMHGST